MSTALPTYSVDTSALIDGLERYYPTANFPALWDRVDELIDAGRLVISEEVWHEVEAKTTATKEWCSRRLDRMVVETNSTITGAVSQILTDHPRLVMNMKGRNRADSFVIALASVRGAIVVTGEGSDGTESRPKIPYICAAMGLPCIRLLSVVQNEGWRFT
jgi:hypothetical protein